MSPVQSSEWISYIYIYIYSPWSPTLFYFNTNNRFTLLHLFGGGGWGDYLLIKSVLLLFNLSTGPVGLQAGLQRLDEGRSKFSPNKWNVESFSGRLLKVVRVKKKKKGCHFGGGGGGRGSMAKHECSSMPLNPFSKGLCQVIFGIIIIYIFCITIFVPCVHVRIHNTTNTILLYHHSLRTCMTRLDFIYILLYHSFRRECVCQYLTATFLSSRLYLNYY